ncbi:hypothetical protein C2I18_00830 [Paenibacillus sp. PK3_47]|uniref:DUF6544 family protein n=1 Tax=Paenibacillus sp. PK3_47 TaxID=2072642 RepID=UPI00201DA29F|nr:DUF6544 family protein [Paenibacillus sp. PK3_47]UQZ32217.1 hypothetical protein C2I18_00830 [Paenibacillus sp. PK3_47]
MVLLLSIAAVIVMGLIVFFSIPYSKTKAEFSRMSSARLADHTASNGVFTREDWAGLPLPVRRYFETSGFTGMPKMSSMKAEFTHVEFILSANKPAISIDYSQYNFVLQPDRIALIDTSMYGVPFQGLDSYVNGAGSMKGVLAKTFTLFDQRGHEMDQACLVTFLSEVLLLPGAALQHYIGWEAIDDTQARATITSYGISASGIFSFRDNGECQSFTTDDRTAVGMDGSKQQVKWSARLGNYKVINGIRQPTHLQAIWHYPGGDLVYFDSHNLKVEYR